MKTINVYILLLAICLFSGCGDYADKNADFLLETVFIENDERLLDYYAVNAADRTPCFIEEFDDNISQFPYPIGSYSDGEVSIADGKMTIDYYADSLIYSIPVSIEIDNNKNFEMEIALIVTRNDSVWQHTFAWLPNQANGNEYAMVYMQNEDIQNKKLETILLRNITDDWESLKGYDFNAKDFLNFNEFTVFTVRKIGNKYAIFINYKLFYIINDKNFSYIPSMTTDESVINVFDYFRVYYLP